MFNLQTIQVLKLADADKDTELSVIADLLTPRRKTDKVTPEEILKWQSDNEFPLWKGTKTHLRLSPFGRTLQEGLAQFQSAWEESFIQDWKFQFGTYLLQTLNSLTVKQLVSLTGMSICTAEAVLHSCLIRGNARPKFGKEHIYVWNPNGAPPSLESVLSKAELSELNGIQKLLATGAKTNSELTKPLKLRTASLSYFKDYGILKNTAKGFVFDLSGKNVVDWLRARNHPGLDAIATTDQSPSGQGSADPKATEQLIADLKDAVLKLTKASPNKHFSQQDLAEQIKADPTKIAIVLDPSWCLSEGLSLHFSPGGLISVSWNINSVPVPPKPQDQTEFFLNEVVQFNVDRIVNKMDLSLRPHVRDSLLARLSRVALNELEKAEQELHVRQTAAAQAVLADWMASLKV